MSRRGENIYKRKDGRWEGRYIKNRKPNGKIHYGSVYGNSYREVKEKLQNFYNEASFYDDDKRIYSELLFQWLYSKKICVKESTYAQYDRMVKLNIIPYIGTMKICDIQNYDIENYIRNMLVSGKINEKEGLSPKTVSNLLMIIKASLEYGRQNGYHINCHEKNICVRKREKEMRILSTSEQKIFSNFLRNHMDLYKFGTLLSLYTGIRIGELCALKWENIDLEQKIIRITETLQRIPSYGEYKKSKIIITEPKSKSSIRKIPIPDFLIPIIKQFESAPKSFLLTGKENYFAEPRTVQYHFSQYIKKCNLLDTNFHALRHTFATRCVEAGFEIKSLSEILGHSNINITLDRYVHSSFQLKIDNMNKLTF